MSGRQQQYPPSASVIPQGVGAPPPPGLDPKRGKLMCIKVRMLDDTVGVFHLGHKAVGQALFDEVCRHLNLLECDYFGLEFLDCYGNHCWLDKEKPILRQITATQSDARFYFVVKFYTPNPADLEEEYTRFLFALQIKRDLATGQFVVNENTAALMVSYIVQADCGDFSPEDYHDHTYLSCTRFLPNQTPEFEKKVMDNHRKLVGMSPADADLALLETARRCDFYGVKFHPARDIEGTAVNLATLHLGIRVFHQFTCASTFSWAKIRKMSFKRKKFLIKLHPESYQYYKDTVEFVFETRNESKAFWKKCVENHAFFRCNEPSKIAIKQSAMLFSKGSSFRYYGRTQKQLIDYVREHRKRREPFTRPIHSAYRNGRAVASAAGYTAPGSGYASDRSLPTPMLPAGHRGSHGGQNGGVATAYPDGMPPGGHVPQRTPTDRTPGHQDYPRSSREGTPQGTMAPRDRANTGGVKGEVNYYNNNTTMSTNNWQAQQQHAASLHALSHAAQGPSTISFHFPADMVDGQADHVTAAGSRDSVRPRLTRSMVVEGGAHLVEGGGAHPALVQQQRPSASSSGYVLSSSSGNGSNGAGAAENGAGAGRHGASVSTFQSSACTSGIVVGSCYNGASLTTQSVIMTTSTTRGGSNGLIASTNAGVTASTSMTGHYDNTGFLQLNGQGGGTQIPVQVVMSSGPNAHVMAAGHLSGPDVDDNVSEDSYHLGSDAEDMSMITPQKKQPPPPVPVKAKPATMPKPFPTAIDVPEGDGVAYATVRTRETTVMVSSGHPHSAAPSQDSGPRTYGAAGPLPGKVLTRTGPPVISAQDHPVKPPRQHHQQQNQNKPNVPPKPKKIVPLKDLPAAPPPPNLEAYRPQSPKPFENDEPLESKQHEGAHSVPQRVQGTSQGIPQGVKGPPMIQVQSEERPDVQHKFLLNGDVPYVLHMRHVSKKAEPPAEDHKVPFSTFKEPQGSATIPSRISAEDDEEAKVVMRGRPHNRTPAGNVVPLSAAAEAAKLRRKSLDLVPRKRLPSPGNFSSQDHSVSPTTPESGNILDYVSRRRSASQENQKRRSRQKRQEMRRQTQPVRFTVARQEGAAGGATTEQTTVKMVSFASTSQPNLPLDPDYESEDEISLNSSLHDQMDVLEALDTQSQRAQSISSLDSAQVPPPPPPLASERLQPVGTFDGLPGRESSIEAPFIDDGSPFTSYIRPPAARVEEKTSS